MNRLYAGQRYGRDVWLLCTASALGSGAYLGINQLLNALYVLRLGYDATTVGTLSAVGAMSFAASSFLGGLLGTRLGARRMMFLGVAVNTMGMAILPLAGSVPAGLRIPWLVLSQLVASAGWSMQVVSVIATMAAYTEPANRRSAYALREASSGLGMLLGAFLGGVLPGVIARLIGVDTDLPAPYAYALWVSVLVGLMNLVPIWLLTSAEAPVPAKGMRSTFRIERAIILLVACGFATNAAHAACKTFSSVYMDVVHRLPTTAIGAVTSVGMLAAIVAALSSARLARRRSSGQMMALAAAGIAASLMLMALVPHWIGAAAGVVGVFGILGIWRPAFQALQMEAALRPEWRSLISGASSMGMSLGFGSMSYGGGHIVTAGGYPPVFLAGALMALASVALSVPLARHMARRAGQAPGADESPAAMAACEPALRTR